MHLPENFERQEEKQSSNMEIMLKRHLVIKFRLIMVSEIILGLSRSFRDYVNKFNDCHTEPIQINK